MTPHPDDMFTPAALRTILENGGRVWVSIGPQSKPDVPLTEDDLTCSECGSPFDPPKDSPVSFLARNKVLNDGVCVECDPPDNPLFEIPPGR